MLRINKLIFLKVFFCFEEALSHRYISLVSKATTPMVIDMSFSVHAAIAGSSACGVVLFYLNGQPHYMTAISAAIFVTGSLCAFRDAMKEVTERLTKPQPPDAPKPEFNNQNKNPSLK
jgi:hypothetical protein